MELYLIGLCCKCVGLLAIAVVVCVLVDYIPPTCVLCELTSERFVQVRLLLLARQTLVDCAVDGGSYCFL